MPMRREPASTMPMTVKKTVLLLTLVLTAVPAATQPERDVVEIVVTGRQPGPPLWRVSNGDNVMWILPLVSVVPKDMIWEDDRVAGIIAGADEYISPPDISVGVPKTVLLNPINWIRGPRLFSRISRNPDGATLADVLPPETYTRYSALKERYLPRDRTIDKLRPLFAIDRMAREILDAEQLTSSGVISDRVRKLLRRNRDIRHTDVQLEEVVDGNFRELSERAQAMMDSMAQDHEIGCFESNLVRFERHLGDMKEVANAWATGNARDIEDYAGAGSMKDSCATVMLASSEGRFIEKLLGESIQRWLDAATKALEANRSTFTMLSMAYITGDLSLTDRLVAMGYSLHIPN